MWMPPYKKKEGKVSLLIQKKETKMAGGQRQRRLRRVSEPD